MHHAGMHAPMREMGGIQLPIRRTTAAYACTVFIYACTVFIYACAYARDGTHLPIGKTVAARPLYNRASNKRI